MHLFVGSSNPVKINAVTIAASEAWPDFIVQGYEVESGIPAQPMGDDETRLGAENRAKAALRLGIRDRGSEIGQENLGVGLEGGVFETESGDLWSTVWVVVADQQRNLHHANGARFKIPESIATPIREGREMGLVVNKMFGGQDVRRANGAIGVVTKNFVDRTEEYAAIAKLALGLWYGRDWESQLIVDINTTRQPK